MNKTKAKFGMLEDNFTSKLIIFYDKYQLVGLFQDAYLKDTFPILTDQVQIYFYANFESSISFNNLCRGS